GLDHGWTFHPVAQRDDRSASETRNSRYQEPGPCDDLDNALPAHTVGMAMVGVQVAQSRTRHYEIEFAVAISFSLVLFLIADLDRPQEGLINVSQEAMTELQSRLNR